MNISPISLPSVPNLTPAAPQAQGGDFRNVLQNAIQQVEGANTSAQQSVEKFLSGDGDELHTTILATQRAELEFDLMMQVRNKVVSAYQEVMRMQM